MNHKPETPVCHVCGQPAIYAVDMTGPAGPGPQPKPQYLCARVPARWIAPRTGQPYAPGRPTPGDQYPG